MTVPSTTEAFRSQIARAVRRAMSEQDRDPYSPTYGCFDRRYWGWKLADMPEASLQRNAQAVAAALVDPGSEYHGDSRVRESLIAGVRYAVSIQRRDGSFDQAFPYERSVSVTAFLLHAFVDILGKASAELDKETRGLVEAAARRGADFLCAHEERHGHIANHEAAVALALALTGDHCGIVRYSDAAATHLDHLLAHQSPEGWFVEYDGADPGYQTLCLYYLALLHGAHPAMIPDEALRRAVDFVSCCVHPDGTFGGEYGARRTAVFYPGGIALLRRMFPMADAITRFMTASIATGRTTTLTDIDIGNLAPLLSNCQLAVRSDMTAPTDRPASFLPCQDIFSRDLPQAGIYVRSTPSYHAVLGASNGGVLKIFDKHTATATWDDAGYMGEARGGRLLSTQVTDRSRRVTVNGDVVEIEAPFYDVLNAVPTPWTFSALRLASLTVMRAAWVAELIKRALVRLLITGKRRRQAQLSRRITFTPDTVSIEDEIVTTGVWFQSLSCGRRFTAIHMASAKYFEGASPAPGTRLDVDVAELHARGRIVVKHVVSVPAHPQSAIVEPGSRTAQLASANQRQEE